MRTKRWDENDLRKAVLESTSVRQVIQKLGLVEAGGNYVQIKKYIALFKIDQQHFTGAGWSKGKKFGFSPRQTLESILTVNNDYQSHKLKNRLFREGIKVPRCELCGWAKKAVDGRLPLELDHINGDRRDNRLENLRILCPNCHSLQSTHRGKNKKKG